MLSKRSRPRTSAPTDLSSHQLAGHDLMLTPVAFEKAHESQAHRDKAKPAMAPLLNALKSLRRASRQSFRATESSESSSDADAASNGTAPTSGSITPPSISAQSDPAINLKFASVDADGPYTIAARPPLGGHGSGTNLNRYSMFGPGGMSPPAPRPPRGKYAPRLTNVEDRVFVHQKVLALRGEVGEPGKLVDGTVTIHYQNNQMPSIDFPVCASSFKALVPLIPGTNRLRMDYAGPKHARPEQQNSSWITVNYVPTTNSPPLQLAILVAKDSPRTFDSIPSRIDREGNGLDTAIRKFRMAAYLWQAFTGEQMARHAREEKMRLDSTRTAGGIIEHRSFRFEEEWTYGTSNAQDRENGTMRSEARVHIIEMDKTVAEIRDADIAQQNDKASSRDGLFGIAMDAVKGYFKAQPGQKTYVAALMLDSHWDTTAQLITGHAALGGGDGQTNVALFGSHSLWSYPTCLEEVEACFTDCNPTDSKLVANDCREAGSSWEACNIGIGAHLHEVGHLFGLPHRPSGVMARDYVRLHRSFVSREAFCTRTKEKGGPVADKEECQWTWLDYLALRVHPCFQVSIDNLASDPSVVAWPTDPDSIMITSQAGLSHVELYPNGEEDWCETVTYDRDVRSTMLREKELRYRLPPGKRNAPFRLVARSYGGGVFETADFGRLASVDSSFKVDGRTIWRSTKLGLSNLEDSAEDQVVFKTARKQTDENKGRILRRFVVYHGQYLNGIEFVYDDDSRQLFGNKGGKPGGDAFDMNVLRGEQLAGFKVKSGHWINAIQILTDQNRRSPWYGVPSSTGVSLTHLVPPKGFQVCGVAGSCGPSTWVDGFSILYRRG
ncbi:metallopeptidase [Magnaporthiopsis poae ATCC 64411]|uniref:Metallopeptidase n=1 Tax=Magnaporthiopsis poae (strain ATCC 64411 / 73-15) TaxID=644358 RepID=A0A0C4DUC9_MAGP6|nr:metallopeptidase [Magnaporthiopsis poae ATCC 64411]